MRNKRVECQVLKILIMLVLRLTSGSIIVVLQDSFPV